MDGEDLTIEGLVHDLNNVFQTIGETAELLESDPQWKKLAGTLERTVERGRRIVWSIMETSRAQAELGPVVKSAIEFAQDYLECVHAPSVTFRSTVPANLPIAGHAAAWERVLVNLLLNAAQAGARNVEISASGGEISIRDDGAGIAEQVLPRIFEPRVTTRSAVHGLGLSIVRSIVERNGGTVSAANRPTGGAEFVIRMEAARNGVTAAGQA
ncbi:MAG TPA: HAMP domain-containing sensor histidine kinase [Bryobacteraceae bacterium]|nr:HAMP domain-containing sensor histidine kinase [Bryobacteraceae bacterium]